MQGYALHNFNMYIFFSIYIQKVVCLYNSFKNGVFVNKFICDLEGAYLRVKETQNQHGWPLWQVIPLFKLPPLPLLFVGNYSLIFVAWAKCDPLGRLMFNMCSGELQTLVSRISGFWVAGRFSNKCSRSILDHQAFWIIILVVGCFITSAFPC